ncbi:Multidrug resistance protein MdtG [uncultured archaeon]|nr:Multidrug resistance protein MdtG [uncultured archaeon]
MNKIIDLLIISSFFYGLAAGLLGPIYAIYVQQIGGDILTAGYSYALFTIICGVFILLLGIWENRAKHEEKIIFASRLLAVIGFIGYLFVSTPTDLFLVQIILGISMALIVPAFDSFYSKHLDKHCETEEWGAWEGFYQISLGISAAAGAIIADFFGFKTLIWLMIIFAVFSLIVVCFMTVKSKKNKKKVNAPKKARKRRQK